MLSALSSEELATYLEFEVMVVDGHSEGDRWRQADALIEAFAIDPAGLIPAPTPIYWSR